MHKKKGHGKDSYHQQVFKANQVQVKSNGQTVKQSKPTSGKGKKKGGNEEIQKYIGFFFYILLTSLPSA